jgi:hypothetical protein
MAQIIQATPLGLPRVLVQFGRKSDRRYPAGGKDWRSKTGRDTCWFDIEVSSRGL